MRNAVFYVLLLVVSGGRQEQTVIIWLKLLMNAPVLRHFSQWVK